MPSESASQFDDRLAGSPDLWREAHTKVASLTTRELQVLTLIAKGRSNKEIAEELSISRRTVEIHRGNMMIKLGANRAADVARIAVYAALADRASHDITQ